MEIEGMIIQVLEPLSGTSTRTGNVWKKREYVLETFGEYPRKIKFDVWGDKSDTMLFESQKSYAIQVDVESREFNGRWYTDVKAFSSREITNPNQNLGGAPGPQQNFPPASNPQGVQTPAPQNPFGNPAPAGNPFGQAKAPDFSQNDSTEDLPF